MADNENIVIGVKIETGEAAKSLKQLKTEYKEQQAALEGLSVGTQEYVNQLKKLGATKDDISDLNTTIKSFNPEGKVQAFTSVIGGVASGFQAATSAAALFGMEGKAIQETLLKVQAASGLAEGIKGVVGLGDSFKVLAANLQTTAIGQKIVTIAQKAWNAVLAANPIAIIVIALAALTSGIALFISATNNAAAEQEKLNKKLEEENRQIEKDIALLELKSSKQRNANKEAIDLLNAQGASEEQLLAFKLKSLDDEDKANKKLYKEKLALYNNDKKVYEGLLKLKGDSSEQEDKDELKSKKDALDKEFIEVQKLYDSKDAYKLQSNVLIAEDERKTREANKIADDKALEESKKREAERVKASGEAWLKEIAAKELAQANSDLIAEQAAEQESLRVKTSGEEWMAEFEKKQQAEDEEQLRQEQIAANNEAIAAQEKSLLETKYKLTLDSLQSIQSLTDIAFGERLAGVKKGSKEEETILRKQFEVNKALQLSMTAVTGIQNGIAAYGAGIKAASAGGITAAAAPIWGAAYAAISAVGTLAALAKIKNTQFGSTSTPAASGGGSVGLGSQGATINAPSTASTMINADGTVKQQAPNQKVYVVESDISTKQKTVATIEENAKV